MFGDNLRAKTVNEVVPVCIHGRYFISYLTVLLLALAIGLPKFAQTSADRLCALTLIASMLGSAVALHTVYLLYYV